MLDIFVVSDLKLNGVPNAPATTGTITTLVGILFGIIGALALAMIVVSGVRYIVSVGDPGRAAKARNGILYAVVGLVVSISAEVIVQFVVGKL